MRAESSVTAILNDTQGTLGEASFVTLTRQLVLRSFDPRQEKDPVVCLGDTLEQEIHVFGEIIPDNVWHESLT